MAAILVITNICSAPFGTEILKRACCRWCSYSPPGPMPASDFDFGSAYSPGTTLYNRSCLPRLFFCPSSRSSGMSPAQDPGYVARLLAAQPPPGARPALFVITWGIRFVFLVAIVILLIARMVRYEWWRRKGVTRISYPDGRSIEVVRGFTVLEASRLLGVPHAAICGGKGRCTTCP